MSHLTLLSPEHIVYVLGELRLREHLICFRPAEPLFKELHIQYVPVWTPWFKSSLVLTGPDNLLFLL